jgi:hypothetical protein
VSFTVKDQAGITGFFAVLKIVISPTYQRFLRT